MNKVLIGCMIMIVNISMNIYQPSRFVQQFPEKLNKKVNKTIRKAFEIKDFKLEILEACDDSPQLDLFEIMDNKNNKIGYAMYSLVSSCKIGGCMAMAENDNGGLHDEFSLLTLYDLDFKIKRLKVLAYDAEYGYEVTARSWLKQFIGNFGDDLERDKDIDGISGATISVDNLLAQLTKQHKCIIRK